MAYNAHSLYEVLGRIYEKGLSLSAFCISSVARCKRAITEEVMTKQKCLWFINRINAGCSVNMEYETLTDFMISCGEHKIKCSVKIEGDKIGATLTAGS